MNDHRHPKGTPAGGQFAASMRSASDIGSLLTAPSAFDEQTRRALARRHFDAAIAHLAVTAPTSRHLDNGYHEGLAHADFEAHVVLTRGAPADEAASTETAWLAGCLVEEADEIRANGRGTPAVIVPHGLGPMSRAEARRAAGHFVRHALVLADTVAAEGRSINGRPTRQDAHLQGLCTHAVTCADPDVDDTEQERRAAALLDALRARATERQGWTARERRHPTDADVEAIVVTLTGD